jgi:RimJ/RimL family protein N-acetyltransferase
VKQRPSLTTERLHLRPFTLNDAPEVQRLAGDRDIASTTLQIPHPYEDGMAEQWIATHQESYEKGESVLFAIVVRPDDTLIGAMGCVFIRSTPMRSWAIGLANPTGTGATLRKQPTLSWRMALKSWGCAVFTLIVSAAILHPRGYCKS